MSSNTTIMDRQHNNVEESIDLLLSFLLQSLAGNVQVLYTESNRASKAFEVLKDNNLLEE